MTMKWFLLTVYLLFTLRTISCAPKEKPATEIIDNISTYPTNFFKDTVPKFVNNRPIIGVLTIGLGPANPLHEIPYAQGRAYVGASYVKFLESAGARVVPISEDIKKGDLHDLLNQINGVLLPGSDRDSEDSGYYAALKTVMEYSKKQMKTKKIKFPVLGISRGAERMAIQIAGKDVLWPGDGGNMTVPLALTADVLKSKLFGHAPAGLIKALETKAMSFFDVRKNIPKESFMNNTKLTKVCRLLSTNFDRNGTNFVSGFEAKKYPWYALLYQPEKAQFEFNPHLSVDHSIHSTIASQYIANFFVSEARQNPNRFASYADENDVLIGKDHPIFVGNVTETQYDQIYVFDIVTDPKGDEKTEDDEEDTVNFGFS